MLAHGVITGHLVERLSKIQDVLLTYIVLVRLRCCCCRLSKKKTKRKNPKPPKNPNMQNMSCIKKKIRKKKKTRRSSIWWLAGAHDALPFSPRAVHPCSSAEAAPVISLSQRRRRGSEAAPARLSPAAGGAPKLCRALQKVFPGSFSCGLNLISCLPREVWDFCLLWCI